MVVLKPHVLGGRRQLSRLLVLLAVCVLAMAIGATSAHAATSGISDLVSSTHPDDEWSQANDASFAWRQRMDYGLSPVGEMRFGAGRSAAVVGNLAYVTNAHGLQVVDVSDPSAPKTLGVVRFSGVDASWDWEGDIAVSGNLAFVVADGRTLIIDVSEPANPRQRGSFASPTPMDVAAQGTTFYVADNNASALYVLDASDPDNPKVMGTCAVGAAPWGMSSVVNEHVAVAIAGSVRIVDVSDPVRPTEVGSFASMGGEFITGVELVGTTAYAVSMYESAGLIAVDITNPASPVRMATTPLPIMGKSVVASGNRVYATDTYGGLYSFDISDRLAPRLTGIVPLAGVHGLTAQGRLVYVASERGFDIFDGWERPAVRATPAASVPANTYGYGGHAVSGTRLYVPRAARGFDIYDVETPATPVKLGSFDTSGSVSAIAAKGDYAFVLDGNKGLKSFDVSNPAAPKIVGEITKLRGSSSWDELLVSGNTLIVQSDMNYWTPTSSYPSRMSIIDITDPRNPSVAQSIYGSYVDADVSGDTVYGLVPGAGVHIIDISRPESSTIIGAIPVTSAMGMATAVAIEGDDLYVSGEGVPVTRFDISDPRNAVKLGIYLGVTDPVGLDVVGDIVYIAGRGAGLEVVDFSDAKNPESLGLCNTPGDPVRVTILGTTAFVGDLGSVAIVPGLPQPTVEYSWAVSTNATAVPDIVAERGRRTASFTDLVDGEHYFKVRPILDGIARATETKRIRVDTTAPSTEASIAAQTAGTTRSVELAASDLHSGVRATWYRLGSGGKTLYEGPFEVAQEETTISYWSEDVAGNTESAHKVSVTVDKEAPHVADDAPSGWVSHDVTVTIEATDSPSGVATIEWELSGAADATGTVAGDRAMVNVSAEGTYVLTYSATDSVGNRTELLRREFGIDTTAPQVSLDDAGSLGHLARYSLAGSDSRSGVTLHWHIDGGTVQHAQATSAVVTCDVDGSHTIEAWATDEAGNESAHVTDTFRVDAPLATLTVAGSDRFATAVEVSKQAYPRGAGTVVVATGMNWPDALGGSALAGALGAPVLLVTPDAVPAVTAAEIKRLGAKDAVILGGGNAVSAKVATALQTMLSGQVTRIGGQNRDRTAELVAARTRSELGGDFDGTVFVASDMDYADAVAAGPMAARNGWPLYLVQPGTSLSPLTKAALAGANRAIIVGGASDVSAATKSDLATMLGEQNVTRVAGTDRYTDVVAIASYAVEHAGFGWNRIGITTGLDYPDALTGGILQAKAGAVMVMTPSSSLHPAVAKTLRENSPQIDTITFFGGINAVNRDVRDAVMGAGR